MPNVALLGGPLMRTIKLALIAAAISLAVTGSTALAASGSFTTDDGPSCTWTSYSSTSYDIDCSGYSRRARQYVSYTCDVSVYGSSSSYRCRDRQGNTWQGSN